MSDVGWDFLKSFKSLVESREWPVFISYRSHHVLRLILLEGIKKLVKFEGDFHIVIVCSAREDQYLLEEFLKNNLDKKRIIPFINVICLDDLFTLGDNVAEKCFIFYDCVGDLLSPKRIDASNKVLSRSFEFLLFLDHMFISRELVEKITFKNNAKIFNLFEQEINAKTNYLNSPLLESCLNKNQHSPLTKKEWIHMFVSSRIFTFIASCLTLGLYYLYYLFCLEQERDSPFVSSDKGIDKYSWDNPYSSNKSFNEAQNINRNLHRLASAQRDQNKFLMNILKDSWFSRMKMHLSIIANNILGFFEGWIVWIFKQDIQTEDKKARFLQQDIKDWFKFEQKTKSLIRGKLKSFFGIYDEEADLINSLATSLLGRKTPIKRDYYLTFVFYVTYLLLSVFTMGIFPVYHLLFKNRWSDFRNIRRHREHAQQVEFNKLTDKLLGDDGNIEYSYLLLGRNKLPLNLNFFSDAFRTKIFESRLTRQKIVTFLMIITMGLFGVLIISKNVFDKPELNISLEDSKMTDYSKIKRKIDRFKFFLVDLARDLGVANKIAARRISTINSSINSLLESNGRKDFWIVKFMGLLSSELYFWLFSFIFILTGITGLSTWIYLCPDNFYFSVSFWLSFSSMLFFLMLFTRHIRLLFN